ncbi:MAG: hypothetical protein HOC74_06435 [Gemmatimonadetes bacterium]|jgi:hypothetical protein|nr:hypothetical protein [Gemmatimonadota bacterium]
MGGPGSGWTGIRHTTVEECLQLDAHQFARMLKQKGKIEGDTVSLNISYRMEGKAQRQALRLESITIHLGGKKWYWICPLQNCDRRVSKLYLPPGGQEFGCRHCHSLTYRSCQIEHTQDGVLDQLGSVITRN